jgi:hypothetical protein
LESLADTHSEYNWVDQKMHQTIRNHATGTFDKYNIIRVEKVHNLDQFRRYERRRRQIEQSNGGDDNVRWLFHGTNQVDQILRDGFDVGRAGDGGMFGRGKSELIC